MRRLIARMLPGSAHQQNREDAYQSVCEALLRNNYKRLQSYSGRGSLSGFVLHVIENLIIDYVRTIAPRRRLPAAIQRLPELDQSVFRLLYWERIAPEPAVLIAHLARGREQPPEVAVIAEAVTRVRKVVPASYLIDMSGPGQMVDLSAAEGASLAGGAEDLGLTTPEDMLIERQGGTLLEGAVAALQRALPKLDAAERLYLQWALSGLPAREIARLTGKAAEDVHKIAQRVKRRLREELSDEDSVKKWRLSV